MNFKLAAHKMRFPNDQSLYIIKLLFCLSVVMSIAAAEISMGRETNDQWRKDAAERIEKIRKADIIIQVTDKGGRAVNDAEVSIKMQKHEFAFGSAVSAILVGAEDITRFRNRRKQLKSITQEDCQQYRDIILKYFNVIATHNGMKWKWWYITGVKELVDNTVTWAKNNGIAVRGHCIIWPGRKHLPKDLQKLQKNPYALRKRIEKHINDLVGHYNGQISAWDVINEPIPQHDLMDILGNEIMLDWLSLTRRADPNAKLFINDYGILASRKNSKSKRNKYAALIRYFIDNGAPLDGIAMQGHFKFKDGSDLTPPQKIYEIFDRFSSMGKSIIVSEFDINVPDEQAQADYMRDFMTMVFSHPSVDGLLMWGFWEGTVWRPHTALWRRDWSIKPNGQVWIDLVHKKWWTDIKGKTDKKGIFKARGFLGDYEVVIKKDNKSKKKRMKLPKNGKKVKAVL